MPEYLIRFDDICPTMNWEIWDKIESILDQHKVRPILAIVPDNKDTKLMVGPKNNSFWDRASAWKKKEWTLGLHGYQHIYQTDQSGIIGINSRSEFAGRALNEQRNEISLGLTLLKEKDIHPEIWIAPAHSFDENTLIALRENGIHKISDGFAMYPYTDQSGMFWLPQQLWRFRSMPFGVWTICNHHNSWTEKDLSRFSEDIQLYKNKITDLKSIESKYLIKKKSPSSIVSMWLLPRLLKAKLSIRKS